ncbi:hypothetical protein QYE76_023653 [Lolium multiflorum]|uniref:Receptor kinase-like protein Xa21 n=1 Tax=Lolium multiflorum TaxID=4521 RepID=A0AAD8RC62_LOLMU|nr:hypothetical protein QYE76_023653 [Lolium multiflorum]
MSNCRTSMSVTMASTRPKRPGKLSMLILLGLFLLFFGTIKINCATLPDNSTDVLWLQAFRNEISSAPSGWFNSWNSSSNHCVWPGVRCSQLHPGRVVALELSGLNLVGPISSSIGNLTFLRTLNLSRNSFSGQLPPLIHLQKLQVLDLSMNQLHDSFPYAIVNCSKLRIINLSKNFLVGEIPPQIGLMSNLSVLFLSWNNLTGVIPPTLGNITTIDRLGVAYNNLTGSIPDELGKLQNMLRLGLGANMLSGGFPEGLLNRSNSLQYLALQSNMLNSKLPPNIGNGLPKVGELYLYDNMFEGQIPASLGNISGLQRLELQGNSLTGEITTSLGNLQYLYYLNLEKNNLEANGSEFFNALANCRSLESLFLADNQLQGAIPNTIGNLSITNLVQLSLAGNKFSGTGNIPIQVGSLTGLFVLDLSSNKLTGEIPDTLAKCQSIVTIQMAQNFLVGTIPKILGMLQSLSMLNLSHNYFSGAIPEDLERLQLRQLDLSYNHLQGEIPKNGIFGNSTAVSLQGNWGLCGGDIDLPTCTAASWKRKAGYYLIRVLIPVFGLLSLALVIYLLLLIKRTPKRECLSMHSFGENFLKISYKDLAEATSDFSESNLVGRGSHGTVYRGKLKEAKLEVAVKVFDLDMRGAEKSFLSECEALRSIQHRNLLPIIRACSTVDYTGSVFKALLYEYMPNGNLDTWLHYKGDGKTPKHLGFSQRLSLAVNIADALDYLHHDCGRPTIHCDVKPSNILLNDDMNALLGDFGIASFYVDSSSTSTGSTTITSSVGVKGTIGYIAPEYAGGARKASTSGDVYSFGIVLLEMMTGKRPTDPMFKDETNIVNFVDNNFPREIYHVLDTRLTEECKDFAHAKTVSEG